MLSLQLDYLTLNVWGSPGGRICVTGSARRATLLRFETRAERIGDIRGAQHGIKVTNIYPGELGLNFDAILLEWSIVRLV